MAQTRETFTDVPKEKLEFRKALLEAEGFDVQVTDQGGEKFTLVATIESGAATHTGKDGDNIGQLIANGSSAEGIAQAHRTARAALPSFPHNGCAATLSALLEHSEIPVPMTLGAGAIAAVLKGRGWQRVAVGDQNAGDVGVTFDNTDPPGADHVYLVVKTVDNDEMIIADNQAEKPHQRFASGQGTTPTEYFLRAPT